jgi:hypothetical protein
VSDQVIAGSGQPAGKEKVKLKRKEKYKEAKIFLPSLNVIRDGKPAAFDYHADVLAAVEWEKYSFKDIDKLTLADKEVMDYRHATVDMVKEKTGQFAINWGEKQTEKVTSEIA